MVKDYLPTAVFGNLVTTSFRDSVTTSLIEDAEGQELKLFFYAVTGRGWRELRHAATQWRTAKAGRTITAYIGTDHALTEPDALYAMRSDKVNVYLLTEYSGTYHPKLVWLSGKKVHQVWVGSNNLTSAAMLKNIEFALVVRSNKPPSPLADWADGIRMRSAELTDELVEKYRRERLRFKRRQASAKATSFTWSVRRQPAKEALESVAVGDLVLEVMPRETGPEGNQIQIPIEAARKFFGLRGNARTVTLAPMGTKDFRELRMTVFKNNTARLSIAELGYDDRPCLLVFHRLKTRWVFEIVAKAMAPTRYRKLLKRCTQQTRKGSRRWGLVK